MISGGTASTISRKNGIKARKAKFLRLKGEKITSGIIVAVMKGKDKVIKSAFFTSRKDGTGAAIAARGAYNKGFQFNDQDKRKSLTSISVASVIKSNNLKPDLQAYAEREYLRTLKEELLKRVKGVGEGHAR
jgi:hypothetical protein